VLFSLQEAENLILNPQAPGKPQPEYLMRQTITLAILENREPAHDDAAKERLKQR
jgi:hypothetical protein